MDKKKVTYIGVTGVTSFKQVQSLSELFGLYNLNGYKLKIGALTNSDTARGYDTEKRFAARDKLKNIFCHDENFNILHFTTETPASLVEDLKLLWSHAGDHCHGVQLNVGFPSIEAIKQIKKICFNKSKRLVGLEISPAMLKEYNPKQLVKRFEDYETRFYSIIDYVLLDCSSDKGKIIPVERIRDYVYEIKAREFSFGLGLAGSLGPDNLLSIEDVVKRYPCLSIDAERGIKNYRGTLDEEKSFNYFDKAADLYTLAAK